MTTNHNEIDSIEEDTPLLTQSTETPDMPSYNRTRHSVAWVTSLFQFWGFFLDQQFFFSFEQDFGRWGKVEHHDFSAASEGSITAEDVAQQEIAHRNNSVNSAGNSRSPLTVSFRRKRATHTDPSHKLLNEWAATAIAGNDISSSCLYTAGICAQKGRVKTSVSSSNLSRFQLVNIRSYLCTWSPSSFIYSAIFMLRWVSPFHWMAAPIMFYWIVRRNWSPPSPRV